MLFKDLSDNERIKIASRIEFNVKAEAEASEFYLELLNQMADEDQIIIKNIIADELNHAIILGKLQEKYTKIFPSEFQALITLKKKEGKE